MGIIKAIGQAVGGTFADSWLEVYEPDDVIVDLLDVAAKTLVLEGRIAYLLPTYGECGFRVDLM